MLFLTLMLVVSAYASEDTTQYTPAPNGHAPMIRSDGIAPKHIGTLSTDYSSNWAGYAVTGPSGSITNVKGSWIVPKVIGNARSTWSANWIGIDGFSSGSVEQIGTDSDTDSKGNPSYYAWFEFYPQACYIFNTQLYPVKPGDIISAEVSFTPSTPGSNVGTYSVILTDINPSNNVISWTTPAQTSAVTYDRSSAEWINEAPSMGNRILPLTDFGTTLFGYGHTNVGTLGTNTITGSYTMKGQTDVIGSSTTGGTIHSIDMASTKSKPNNIITKATTSALSDYGTSFQVQWVRAS